MAQYFRLIILCSIVLRFQASMVAGRNVDEIRKRFLFEKDPEIKMTAVSEIEFIVCAIMIHYNNLWYTTLPTSLRIYKIYKKNNPIKSINLQPITTFGLTITKKQGIIHKRINYISKPIYSPVKHKNDVRSFTNFYSKFLVLMYHSGAMENSHAV